ncbi:hypothetical protein BT63DRAFT_457603 [Microthyrium microscopicum]|uniref:Uncharacterized protein n=1 Tax=Microthyrium microscopicum TaxID=703497 RepID=A0A6A6U500_9PEZI|nr:hypothetical protein BT63DRAFT_457603 [Microthyrium microscopicum]
MRLYGFDGFLEAVGVFEGAESVGVGFDVAGTEVAGTDGGGLEVAGTEVAGLDGEGLGVVGFRRSAIEIEIL